MEKYEHIFNSSTKISAGVPMKLFVFFLQHLWTLMVEESDLLGQLKVNINHLLIVRFCWCTFAFTTNDLLSF